MQQEYKILLPPHTFRQYDKYDILYVFRLLVAIRKTKVTLLLYVKN